MVIRVYLVYMHLLEHFLIDLIFVSKFSESQPTPS